MSSDRTEEPPLADIIANIISSAKFSSSSLPSAVGKEERVRSPYAETESGRMCGDLRLNVVPSSASKRFHFIGVAFRRVTDIKVKTSAAGHTLNVLMCKIDAPFRKSRRQVHVGVPRNKFLPSGMLSSYHRSADIPLRKPGAAIINASLLPPKVHPGARRNSPFCPPGHRTMFVFLIAEETTAGRISRISRYLSFCALSACFPCRVQALGGVHSTLPCHTSVLKDHKGR